MKILYESQIFTAQPFGGISNYFVLLMEGIIKSGNEILLPIQETNNKHLLGKPFLTDYLKSRKCFYKDTLNSLIINSQFKYRYQLLNLLEFFKLLKTNERLSKQYLKNDTFDIVHPTYYNPYFLKYIENKRTPFVVTIYDMIHELFPQYYSNDRETIKFKQKLAEKAIRIIAISENTKKDVIRFLGIDEKKIDVVYLSTDFESINFECCTTKLPDKYLLFTGDRIGYKNFDRFIKACAPILREKSIYLICTGKKFSSDELTVFSSLNIKDKVVHFFADPILLKKLYSNALLFVFPSMYEGFGIPVLEAFASGCPIAMSNVSSLPEIGGDAVIYFNPLSEEEIYSTINSIAFNNDLKKSLIESGYKKLKEYTIDKMVNGTLNVYKKAISECKQK